VVDLSAFGGSPDGPAPRKKSRLSPPDEIDLDAMAAPAPSAATVDLDLAASPGRVGRTLSGDVITVLSDHKQSASTADANSEPNEMCAICREDMPPKSMVKILPCLQARLCFHFFVHNRPLLVSCAALSPGLHRPVAAHQPVVPRVQNIHTPPQSKPVQVVSERPLEQQQLWSEIACGCNTFPRSRQNVD
jgi:hypothetical protein